MEDNNNSYTQKQTTKIKMVKNLSWKLQIVTIKAEEI